MIQDFQNKLSEIYNTSINGKALAKIKALEMVKLCEQYKVPILGVDVLKIANNETRPMDILDLSQDTTDSHNQAAAFIENYNNDLYFEVVIPRNSI